MTDIFKTLENRIIKLTESQEVNFLPLVKSLYGDKPETLFRCARFARSIYENDNEEKEKILLECHNELKATGNHKNVKKFKKMFPEVIESIRTKTYSKPKPVTVNIHPMKPTPEQFKRMIELETKDAIEQLKKANTKNGKDLQVKQKFITHLKDILKSEDIGIGGKKLTEAIIALEKGNFSKTDKIFAEIESRKGVAVKLAAHVALARGQIAEQEVRWKNAAEHYTRAIQLDPCFDTLIKAEKLIFDIRNYPLATSIAKQAEKAAIAEYGEDSKQHATSLNNLALAYMEQRQYKNAELPLKESLRIRTKVLGKKHVDTANSLSSLAGFYLLKKYYKKAEPLFIEVIKIKKENFKDSDPRIASTLHNLAGVYYGQKKYKKAILTNIDALNIRKKVFGISHSDTAESLYNLAALYKQQNQPEKAEPLFQQALQIRKKILGEQHPDTAMSLYNLALRYYEHRCYKEAEESCRDALSILEATLEPGNLRIKTVKSNYEKVKKRLDDETNTENTALS